MVENDYSIKMSIESLMTRDFMTHIQGKMGGESVAGSFVARSGQGNEMLVHLST